MTDATERFVALVQGPPDQVRLDDAALLIAAHAHAALDIPARRAQLDALASGVETRDAVGLAAALFGAGGFTGNTVDYYDPANSYLDDVLDRRLGIPITLSVLMIEVGRRCGVELVGVGAPGHFLVGVPAGDQVGRDDAGNGVAAWYDPFHGTGPLDAAGCAALFARLRGAPARPSGSELSGRSGSEPAPAHALDPAFLAPVGPLAILDRMLANLQMTLLRRSPAAAAWPTRLRLGFPSVPPLVRAELAATLGNLGQFGEAAAHLEAVAPELPADASVRVARAAASLRARAN